MDFEHFLKIFDTSWDFFTICYDIFCVTSNLTMSRDPTAGDEVVPVLDTDQGFDEDSSQFFINPHFICSNIE